MKTMKKTNLNLIPDAAGQIPFAVLAQNPNGAFSIATLGRTFGREYYIPKCDVTVACGSARTIGVFGEYSSLIIKTGLTGVKRILIQDLADDAAYDITESVYIGNEELVIPGEIISKIGRISQPADDTSEPGVVIALT